MDTGSPLQSFPFGDFSKEVKSTMYIIPRNSYLFLNFYNIIDAEYSFHTTTLKKLYYYAYSMNEQIDTFRYGSKLLNATEQERSKFSNLPA
jgi:hypothetical protein